MSGASGESRRSHADDAAKSPAPRAPRERGGQSQPTTSHGGARRAQLRALLMAKFDGTARLMTVAAVTCLALLAAQLWLIAHIELTFDEAYYTLWSRSLAWGYLDHPPMVAAWIRA